MKLGYDKPLYLLAFDHRSSFSKGLSHSGGQERYDRELRASLVVEVLRELRGVEPDIWKIEGLATSADCARVVEQARRGEIADRYLRLTRAYVGSTKRGPPGTSIGARVSANDDDEDEAAAAWSLGREEQ